MAAGTTPIFVLTPKAPAVNITAANTKNDGAGTLGTDLFILFTAGSNGSYIGRVRFVISASAASTASTATVARLYRSTKTGTQVASTADTSRIDEVALPSITADQATVQTGFVEITVNSFLAPNETLLVSTHHAPAANTSVQALLMGSGDY